MIDILWPPSPRSLGCFMAFEGFGFDCSTRIRVSSWIRCGELRRSR